MRSMVTVEDVKPVPADELKKRATRARRETPAQKRARVREATTGLKAGVKVTKGMYRPGAGR